MVVSASFHSIVLRLEALGPGELAGMETGYWLYSWLCGQLRPEDSPGQACLAPSADDTSEGPQGWHDSRALALSPLLLPDDPTVATEISVGATYVARLTFLQAAAYEQWRTAVWPRCESRSIRLGPHLFLAIDWTDDPAVHPLAQRSTAGDIIQWGQQHAGEALTLRFLTPTFLKFTYWPTGSIATRTAAPIDLEVLFPEPHRLVGNLARRWQEVAPAGLALPADLIELVQHTTVLSRYELRTEAVRTKVPGRGFTGWATYRCLAPLPEAQAILATLWRFATFCGVGSKTSMGMGLTQLLSAGNPIRPEHAASLRSS